MPTILVIEDNLLEQVMEHYHPTMHLSIGWYSQR
jgi:hypothetical protein